MYRIGVVVCVAFLALSISSSGAGQLVIYEENDTFGLDTPTDRNYTQGLRIEYAWQSDNPVFLSRLVAKLPCYEEVGASFSQSAGIAQNMYTPELITDPVYNPADRPFAGWLYGTWKTVVSTKYKDWQDTYELSLGYVGPSSKSDEAQSWFHRVISDPEDPTYVNQIPDSPVVLVGFKRQWMAWASPVKKDTWPAYIMSSAALRVGNVITDVGFGATLIWGFHAPGDFSAGAISPAFAGEGEPGRFRLYGYAGVEGRAAAFNVFLDGTAGKESASISRNGLVSDYKLGLTVSYWRLRVGATQVWRSPEISSFTTFQNFGAFQIAIGEAF